MKHINEDYQNYYEANMWDAYSLETAQFLGIFIFDSFADKLKDFFAKFEKFPKVNDKLIQQKARNDFFEPFFGEGKLLETTLSKLKELKAIQYELCLDKKSVQSIFNIKSYFDNGKYNVKNISVLFSELYGGYLFRKEINKKSEFKNTYVRVIHKSIKNYYELEKILFPSKISKDNTTDYIIFTGDNFSFLLNSFGKMENKEEIKTKYSLYEWNEDTGVCYLRDAKSNKPLVNFIQVSAKKSHTEGKLGMVLTYVKGILGDDYISPEKIKNEIKEELNNEYDYRINSVDMLYDIHLAINEGIFTNLWNKVVDSFKTLNSFLRGVYSNLAKKFNSIIEEIKDDVSLQVVKDFIKNVDVKISEDEHKTLLRILTGQKVNEAWETPEYEKELNEYFKVKANKLRLISLVENYRDDLYKTLGNDASIGNKNDITKAIHVLYEKINVDDKDDMLPYKTIFSNLVGIKLVNELFANLKKEDKDFIENLRLLVSGITKNAVFGSTEMPLYKVYGTTKVNDDDSFELLIPSSGKEKSFDNIIKTENNSKLLYLTIMPAITYIKGKGKVVNPYYDIDLYMMYGWNQKENEYNYSDVKISQLKNTYYISMQGTYVTPKSKLEFIKNIKDYDK